MQWPWVSRAKFEGLEDRYDDLEKRNKELQMHADKLLDSLLEHPAEKSEEEKRAEERRPLPRRLLNREISAMATQAAQVKYDNQRSRA